MNAPTAINGYQYRIVVTCDATPTASCPAPGCSNSNSSNSDPATLTVGNLPSATIAGGTTVCQNASQPNITITGSGAPTGTTYTFTYTINGQSQTPVTGSPMATISAPTNNPGTFVYSLVSVSYPLPNNGPTCTNLVSETATVSVNNVVVGTAGSDQTVCSGGNPAPLVVSGSGGAGTLSYQWQSSTVSCSSGFSDIAGATSSSYDPPTTSTTAYYRVVVTSTLNSVSCPATSNCVTVTVNNVAAGTAGSDQTVCSGGDPTPLVVSGASGAGTLSYQWQSSTVGCGSGFSNIAGATGSSYDPPATSSTTYYRVVVTSTLNSVSCPAIGNCVTVTVNNVAAGTAGSDQTVCSGGNPAPLVVSGASGAGTLSYQWQSSTVGCGSGFSNIPGATSASYDPPATSSTTYYRVMVASTLNGVPCPATSNCVTVTVNNVAPGTAGSDQAVCSGGDPAPLVVSGASGAGILSYQWQSSTVGCGSGFSNIAGATGSSYDPPATSSTTYYRVVVTSTLNGVPCPATGNCVTITVNGNISAGTAGSDQTVCSGGDPAPLVVSGASGAGTLSYQWQSSTAGCGSGFSNIAGATGTSYDPPVTTSTTYYRVVVTSTLGSAQCTATSNCVTVTVNSVAAGTAGSDQTVCSGGDPAPLVVSGASGAGTLSYQWQSSTVGCGSGFSNIAGATGSSYDPPATSSTTYYRTVVTSTVASVQCTATSNCVTITVNGNISAGTAGSDQTVCSGGDPAPLVVSGASGAGTLSYQWQSSSVGCGSGFSNIAGAASASYNPPMVAATTYYRVVVTSTLNGTQCTATGNCVTVTVNSVTAGTASSDQTVCSGVNPAPLFVSGASGNGALTYQWQSNTTGCSSSFTNIPGATSTNYGPPAATVTTYYRVVITSTQNGVQCTAVSNCVTITVNPTPNIPGGVSNTGPYCAGQTVQLNAPTVSGAIYSWVGPGSPAFMSSQEDPAISNSTQANSGTYTLVVTVNGCASMPSTTQVTVNPIPAAPTGNSPQQFCSASNPTIASLSVQGLPGASFTWYSAQAPGGFVIPANTPLVNGTTYYASQTSSSGCESASRIGILVNIVQTVTPSVSIVTTPASTNNILTICSGTAVSFSASPMNQGTNPMYQWKLNGNNIPGATNPTYTMNTLANGDVITVTLKNNDPCSSTNLPVSSPPINVTVNPNPTVTLTGTPQNPTVCYGATTASLSYTATNGASKYTISYDAIATLAGFSDVVDAQLPTSGGQIVLQIPNNLSNNATPLVYNATISVKTGFGCVSTPVSFSIIINPTPQFSNLNDKTICGGDAVNIPLVTNVNSNFTWKAISDNPDISGESLVNKTTAIINDVLVNNPTVGTTETVSYTVTATSTAHGCPATDQVEVTVNPRPNLEPNPDIASCYGQQVSQITFSSQNFTSGVIYEWTNNNPFINIGTSGNGAFGPWTLPNTPEVATFIVTPTLSSTGCVGVPDTFTVTATETPTIISLPGLNELKGCADGYVSATFELSLGAQIEFDAFGNTYTVSYSQNGQPVEIQLPSSIQTSPFTLPINITPTLPGGTGNCLSGTVTKTFNITVYRKPELIVEDDSGNQNNDGEICYGDGVKLTGLNNSQDCIWSADPMPSTPIDNCVWNIPSLTTTTAFSVFIKNEGCEATKIDTIIVHPYPSFSIIVQNPCEGQQFSVSSSNPQPSDAIYAWKKNDIVIPGATDYSYSISNVPLSTETAGDKYTLEVTSVEGCTSDTSVQVVITEFPNTELSSDNTKVCQNAQVFYKDSSVLPGSSYSWDIEPNNGYEIVDSSGALLWVHWLEPGTYHITTTETYGTSNVGSNACQNSDMITVEVDGSHTAPNDTTIYHAAINNILICLDASAACYEWGYYDTINHDLVGPIPDETYQAYAVGDLFKPDYLYWVKTGTDATCSCYTISYRMTDQIGNEPPDEAPSFALYPNPNQGTFRLEATGLEGERFTLHVFDTWGRKVLDRDLTVNNGRIDGLVEIPDVASGLFTVRLLDGAGKKYRQVKVLVLR